MTRANDVKQRVILLATNSSQSIIGESVEGKVNTIGYSAYGEQSAQQEVASALGFNGQLREAKLGWYLLGNGYRAYNTRLMRFHSPDSWSPFGGGGLNAYMYCVGDPVNRVDPTGHIWDVIKLFARENIRYRTPQQLAIANAKASARQKAISILSRSSRSVEPSNPSRQSDAVSVIGGYIMGAPGARNPTPSPGVDLAPQRVKGWERPVPAQGTSWRVSPTAQQSHSLGASRGGGSFSSTSQPSRHSIASFYKPRTIYSGPGPKEPRIEHLQLLGTDAPPRPNYWQNPAHRTDPPATLEQQPRTRRNAIDPQDAQQIRARIAAIRREQGV
ncbi:RHS repeat-associated core domain-containing protein [Pseudomonas mohnii]|uniref:RHS repeat-associated core domain-containing protein n=1 Tax=Pseudomonas mohnii TaxID=395600 RepID=A0ABY0Y0D1_9PSED|nr:RHS repeat-associated core domain-containing protein [Pseudomonas mohnii]SEC66962.1 RHS repeat-associated core domain-containing protein [Pseudomonas mohnii]